MARRSVCLSVCLFLCVYVCVLSVCLSVCAGLQVSEGQRRRVQLLLGLVKPFDVRTYVILRRTDRQTHTHVSVVGHLCVCAGVAAG